LCDLGDPDDDNDLALDENDLEDNNPNVCSDEDNDGCDDCYNGVVNINDDGFDYDGDGICNESNSDLYPNGLADVDDDNDGVCDFEGDVSDTCLSVTGGDQEPNNEYKCTDTEDYYFDGVSTTGDGCDDCSSGTYDPSDDGNDNDDDGFCDIGDQCDNDPANDADDDGVCFDQENLGCTDENALNADDEATDDDGSCLYSSTYALDYHEGANLASYSLHPTFDDEEYGVSVFADLFAGGLNAVLGAEIATAYNDNFDDWIGSLTDLDKESGYWIKLDSASMVDYVTYPYGQNVSVIDSTDNEVLDVVYEPIELSYSLSQGNNLISFPGENNSVACQEGDEGCVVLNYDFLSVLPDNLLNVLTGVLAEGLSAVNDNGAWIGSLEQQGFDGFKGYWLQVSEDVEFSFNLDNGVMARKNTSYQKEVLPGYEFVQSSQQAFYFVKGLPEANIGDWIVAFHNDVVVGARKWNGEVVDVPVMGNDGESYSAGYTETGSIPTFMLYHSGSGELEELFGSINSFENNQLFIVDQLTTDDYIVPGEVTLHDAYPNPFNPVTNISFSLPNEMHVEVNILDVQGRLVDKVSSGSYSTGLNTISINGANLSSGLYFVQLIAESDIKYNKILLLK
jgi:hypothetical protein